MSFDMLPDELIALVANHFNAVDIPNLLQTQKRTLNVLKNHGLDKPQFEEIEIDIKPAKSGYEITELEKQTNGQNFKIVIQTGGSLDWETLTKFMEKCHSSQKVKITGRAKNIPLDATDAEILSRIAGKTCKLSITSVNMKLSSEEFVNFCQQFSSISLNQITVLEEIICDSVLAAFLETTQIEEFYPHFMDGRRSLCDISDRTLRLLASHEMFFVSFDFGTKFTVSGIQTIVEDAVKKNKPFYMKFGDILSNQHGAANNLLTIFHRGNPQLPFSIRWTGQVYQIYHRGSLATFKIRR